MRVGILFFHGARLALLTLILLLALLAFNLDSLLRGKVTVSVDEAKLFFSTISQAVAALAGLLIAFYFFAMQDLVQRRDEAFRLFKDEMSSFLQLATERPAELAPFDPHMNRIIYSFSLVSLEDCEFPANPSMTKENWGEVTKGMTEEFDIYWKQLGRHARWYLQQLMSALLHAENGLSSLGIYWVGIVVIRRIV